ncbi:MAG: GatB/YqeY domain-containing protein [Chloroflexi bacterium]|nr:GatB/YqeY domain-containing protein [Chloroflexota bacterium]MCI0855472.1 GatB/YqeY domain-containing protein [Chloroflexota bacterium]MCI0889817.1 GatB/YqeY domain-containing protein [Chloroflexota bacterium]
MPLKERLQSDVKDAMRQGDKQRRDTLRLVLSALHNAEIEARGDLDDDGVLRVLTKEAKQRRESIEEFRKGGREEKAAEEEAELEVISSYLPEALSHEEVLAAAKEVIQESGASSMKDIGKVMPALMQRLRGRADGREASEVVRELLSG